MTSISEQQHGAAHETVLSSAGSKPPILLKTLRSIVGRRHVLTSANATRRYRTGYRYGDGTVVAVVRPGSLVELWRTVAACVAADVSLVMQAANTGLTGGSTPDGNDYPGGVIVINAMRIDRIHLIDEGRQAICLPGARLHRLERLLKPLNREPHSVIGSSCIGASVMGGICNNSGGALVQRGPAFTELALFARITPEGRVELVNHLGIELGNDPEAILKQVERGEFPDTNIMRDPDRRASSADDYQPHVRDVESDTPARFNADPRFLFEASGSAGKLILFAVRLDTFASDKSTATFYIGTNNPDELAALRRHMLANFKALPVAGEYVHRTAFDVADRYGRDMFLAIERLGTDRIPALFATKAKADGWLSALGLGRLHLSDHILQFAARLFPDPLPQRMRIFRDRYEHHLMLKMADDGIAEARDYLHDQFPSTDGDLFECTVTEASKAFLHRFAVAGAAVRYRAVHRAKVSDIAALDIALPRNMREWVEKLPSELEDGIIHKLYYGHFFCHVFHQDYILAKGTDPAEFEHKLLELLDRRGAEYPAEHNVGHLYEAKPALADFYRALDPRNQMNPGIGKTSKARFWAPESGR